MGAEIKNYLSLLELKLKIRNKETIIDGEIDLLINLAYVGLKYNESCKVSSELRHAHNEFQNSEVKEKYKSDE